MTNPHRGEVAFTVGDVTHTLRPTFEAVVAIEQVLGPLVALARRSANEGIGVQDLAVLFHHCARAADADAPDIERFGTLIVQAGMAPCLSVFRQLMETILGGQDG